jgi:hypothetical protein
VKLADEVTFKRYVSFSKNHIVCSRDVSILVEFQTLFAESYRIAGKKDFGHQDY